MSGRCDALAGEPWLTIASGNGPGPGGRSTRVRSVAPAAAGTPTISWTGTAGAAPAKFARAGSSNAAARATIRQRRAFPSRMPCIPTAYRPAGIEASAVGIGLSSLTRSQLRPLGIGTIRRAEPERFDHDAEDLGIVHLPAHAFAARPGGRENHVLARMHAGIGHRRQIAEAEYRAGNVLVALVRHKSVGLLAGDCRVVGIVELRPVRLVVVWQARREHGDPAAHV